MGPRFNVGFSLVLPSLFMLAAKSSPLLRNCIAPYNNNPFDGCHPFSRGMNLKMKITYDLCKYRPVL
jgi:hypothetical protein